MNSFDFFHNTIIQNNDGLVIEECIDARLYKVNYLVYGIEYIIHYFDTVPQIIQWNDKEYCRGDFL